MSDIYVGLKAQNIDIGAEMPEITGIRLVVDSDHEYVVGDSAGRMIEVECPWGTEDMAKSILATMSDLQYRPYAAERAMLDPAFELGDSVMVGGVSSAIINSDINYNGAALANIDAPALDEIDDEYPAQPIKASSFERQLAYTRSLISKTAKGIKLEVADEIKRVEGLIDVQAYNLSLSVTNGNTSSAIQLMLTKTDEDGTTSQIALSSQNISFNGMVTFEALADTPGEDTTKINGGWIDTDTLTVKTAYASGLIGEEITIKSTADAEAYGTITTVGSGLVIANPYAVSMEADGTYVQIDGDSGEITVAGTLYSVEHDYLGTADAPWDTLFADSCECCTSDRNRKNTIEDLPDKYVDMFDSLTPRRFKLNSGTSNRYHVGFISQEVEEAMMAAGISSQEFGGFIKDTDEDGNDIYMLRYSEFIAILVAKVQAMQKEINAMKEGA